MVWSYNEIDVIVSATIVTTSILTEKYMGCQNDTGNRQMSRMTSISLWQFRILQCIQRLTDNFLLKQISSVEAIWC